MTHDSHPRVPYASHMDAGRRLLAVTLAGALVGCSGDDAGGAATTTMPVDAGPEAGCGADELAVGDACTTPGVPADACAEGFASDGLAGCAPILPADKCPEGQLAVPGDASCHELMDCGTGPWGAIPVDAATVYVDAAYAGGASDGTEAHPFVTIQEAVDAAPEGGLVAVASGSYVEAVTITSRAVRIHGRCPSMVEVVGIDGEYASLYVGGGADGTEVVGLAFTGKIGVTVSDAAGVVLDRVWIHDVISRGLDVQNGDGPAQATLRDSLVEKNIQVGVLVSGVEATIERSLVRDTKSAGPTFGRGVHVQRTPGKNARGNALVRGSVLEGNHEVGAFTEASDLTVEASVVRDTKPAPGQPDFHGLMAQANPDTEERGTLTVRSSVLVHDSIQLAGSDGLIDASVVRDLEGLSTAGRGVVVGTLPGTHVRSALTMTRSLIDRAEVFGVFDLGSDVTIEGSLVRETLLDADGTMGVGLLVMPDDASGERGIVDVRASAFVRNHSMGILALGSDLVAEDSRFAEGQPETTDGFFGRGIQVQWGGVEAKPVPAHATLRRCAFEDNYEVGLFVVGAQAVIEDSVLRGTKLGFGDSQLGDGIGVAASFLPASIDVTRTRIEGNARAGIANFGSTVHMGDTTLECNAIQLHGDAYQGSAFSYDDRGGNRCACDTKDEACKVLSAGLAAPGSVAAPSP